MAAALLRALAACLAALAAAAEEDCLAQVLSSAALEEEDPNASCSFRQLRGELQPGSPEEREDAGEEAYANGTEEVLGSLIAEHADPTLETDAGYTPLIVYPKNYCHHCGEMAFCHRAGNPGCGGHSMGGVRSFYNSRKGSGCGGVRPILTVPVSFIKNIDELRKLGGGSLLAQMLSSGFSAYYMSGGKPPFWQCIHKSGSVSVRWLHLHTFCKNGRVDNLPSRSAVCAVMYSSSQAGSVAAKLLR